MVRRRGSVFWFRESVPVDLIDRLGKSDTRRAKNYDDRLQCPLRREDRSALQTLLSSVPSGNVLAWLIKGLVATFGILKHDWK